MGDLSFKKILLLSSRVQMFTNNLNQKNPWNSKEIYICE